MLKRKSGVKFRTIVEIVPPEWRIDPADSILCVGSCFAQRIGDAMAVRRMRVDVNPWGTLYNPASIAIALDDSELSPDIVIVTLGTTHVYERDGRVVANCQKLPASLFTERELTTDEVVETLASVLERLRSRNPRLRAVLTVSPYRYAKYGFHGSQLSKARLLMAVDELTRRLPYSTYFPAYEIVLDELRDYRFYDADMLHPNQQAVDYIWERFAETLLSPRCQDFLREMEPIRKALAHKPFDPDSDEYKRFVEEAKRKEQAVIEKFTHF